MLSCKISKGISGVCETSLAGVVKIAFANYDDAYKFTASEGCEVDTIDLGTEKFYEVACADSSVSATADLVVGTNNKYINHTVSGVFPKLDCDLLSEFKNWILGRVIVAVLTKDKQVLVFGADNGLTASTFGYSTGAADSDATGISFTFEGSQINEPILVKDWKTIKDLMA